MSMLRTSRRPSLLTPTGTITATSAAILAYLHVGGVDPQIRPRTLDRTGEEGLPPYRRSRRTVGEPGCWRCRSCPWPAPDRRPSGSKRNPLDIGLLPPRRWAPSRPGGAAPESLEVGALAQLGDTQLDRAGTELQIRSG